MSFQKNAALLCEGIKTRKHKIRNDIEQFFLPITEAQGDVEGLKRIKLCQHYGTVSMKLIQAILNTKNIDNELLLCAKWCFAIAFDLEFCIKFKTPFTIELMYQKLISMLVADSKFLQANECICILLSKLQSKSENTEEDENKMKNTNTKIQNSGSRYQEKVCLANLHVPGPKENYQVVQLMVFCIYNGARCQVELGNPMKALNLGTEKLSYWFEELEDNDPKAKKASFGKCILSLFYNLCATKLDSSSPMDAFRSRRLGLEFALAVEAMCDKNDFLTRSFKTAIQLQRTCPDPIVRTVLVDFYKYIWTVLEFPELKASEKRELAVKGFKPENLFSETERPQLQGILDPIETTLWLEHFSTLCRETNMYEFGHELLSEASHLIELVSIDKHISKYAGICIGILHLQRALIYEKQFCDEITVTNQQWKTFINCIVTFVSALKRFTATYEPGPGPYSRTDPETRLLDRIYRGIEKVQSFFEIRCGEKVRDALCKLCLKSGKLAIEFTNKAPNIISIIRDILVSSLCTCAEGLPIELVEERRDLLKAAVKFADEPESSELLPSVATSSYNIGARLFNSNKMDSASHFLEISCEILEKRLINFLGVHEGPSEDSLPPALGDIRAATEISRLFKPERWHILATCYQKLGMYREARDTWAKSFIPASTSVLIENYTLDSRPLHGFAESNVHIFLECLANDNHYQTKQPSMKNTCKQSKDSNSETYFDLDGTTVSLSGFLRSWWSKTNSSSKFPSLEVIPSFVRQECEKYLMLFKSIPAEEVNGRFSFREESLLGNMQTGAFSFARSLYLYEANQNDSHNSSNIRELYQLFMDAARFSWGRNRLYENLDHLRQGQKYLLEAENIVSGSGHRILTFELLLMKLLAQSWKVIFDAASLNSSDDDGGKTENTHQAFDRSCDTANYSPALLDLKIQWEKIINITTKNEGTDVDMFVEETYAQIYRGYLIFFIDWCEMSGYNEISGDLFVIMARLQELPSSDFSDDEFIEHNDHALYCAVAAAKNFSFYGMTSFAREILAINKLVNAKDTPEAAIVLAEVETVCPFSSDFEIHTERLLTILNSSSCASVSMSKSWMNVNVEARTVRSDLMNLQLRPLSALHDSMDALKMLQKEQYHDHNISGYRTEWRKINYLMKTLIQLGNIWEARGDPRSARYYYDQGYDVAKRINAPIRIKEFLCHRISLALRCNKVEMIDDFVNREFGSGLENIDISRQGLCVDVGVQGILFATIMAEKAMKDKNFEFALTLVEQSQRHLQGFIETREEKGYVGLNSEYKWWKELLLKALDISSDEHEMENLEAVLGNVSLEDNNCVRLSSVVTLRLQIKIECIKGDVLRLTYQKQEKQEENKSMTISTLQSAISCYRCCLSLSDNKTGLSLHRCCAMLGLSKSLSLLLESHTFSLPHNAQKQKETKNELFSVLEAGIDLARKLCDPTLSKALLGLGTEIFRDADMFQLSFGSSICLARAKLIEKRWIRDKNNSCFPSPDIDIADFLTQEMKVDLSNALENVDPYLKLNLNLILPGKNKKGEIKSTGNVFALCKLLWSVYSPAVPIRTVSKVLRSTIDQFLPKNWLTCSLSISPDRQYIFLLRESGGGRKPIFVRIKAENIDKNILDMEALIRQSESTTKGMTAEVAKKLTKQQKLDWWANREQLNDKMYGLLKEIEENWLGVYKVLIYPAPLMATDEGDSGGHIENRALLDVLIKSCIDICCEKCKAFSTEMAERLKIVIEGADALQFEPNLIAQALKEVVGLIDDENLHQIVGLIISKHPLNFNVNLNAKNICIDLTAEEIEQGDDHIDSDLSIAYVPLSKSPSKMLVKELKSALSERGLSTSGLKKVLVKRLKDAINSENVTSKQTLLAMNDSNNSANSKDFNIAQVRRGNLILVLAGELEKIPFESMPILSCVPTTRMPSISFVLERAITNRVLRSNSNSIDGNDTDYCCLVSKENGTFFVDPRGDLSNTSSALSPMLQELRKESGWDGMVGSKPSTDMFKSGLEDSDILLYCGHGTGEEFFSREKISCINMNSMSWQKCATALLMGCSSGKLQEYGEFEPAGVVWSYILAGSNSVVCCLWDVTDKDIDRYTLKLVGDWIVDEKLNSPYLAEAVADARDVCKLRYLVGAAPICYGVPTKILQ